MRLGVAESFDGDVDTEDEDVVGVVEMVVLGVSVEGL
jgi:hypothetical protein